MLAGEMTADNTNQYLNQQHTAGEAFQILRSCNLFSIPVLDKELRVIGVVSRESFFQGISEIDWFQPVTGLMSNSFKVAKVNDFTSDIWEDQSLNYVVLLNDKNLPGMVVSREQFKISQLEKYRHKVKQLEGMLDSSHVGIVAINEEGKIIYFNQAAEQIVWRKKEEALGRHLSQVIIPQGLLEVLLGGEAQLCHKFSIEYSSQVRTYLTHRTPIMDNGKVIGAVGVFQDISDIESISEELSVVKQLNSELETIIEASYDGILVANSEGIALRVNNALKRLLSISTEQIVEQSLFGKESGEKLVGTMVEQVTKKKKTINSVVSSRGRQLMLTGNPVVSNSGEIERVVVNIRDMTELNSLRLELEQTKELTERYQSELSELKAKLSQQQGIVINSQSMQKTLDLAVRVSQVDSTVLILGESGVGKEVIAKVIHNNSKRINGPFIKVNCGAIPENLLESELFGYQSGAFTGASKDGKLGMFELAHHGTLFLDEIGDLPLQLQVKLLRAIQDREINRVGGEKPIKIDVRILTATNKDLSEMVEQGKFREDLYFRLNVIPINIPPLRDRKEEIIPLIKKFQEKFSQAYQLEKEFSPESMEALLNYSWPGNVRELENAVERLIVTAPGQRIGLDDLPSNISEGQNNNRPMVIVRGILPLKKAILEVEKQLLDKAMERYGSAYKAAKILDVNQSTISRKLAKIKPKD
jgi:PAS domain S-box-containing protein